MGTALLTSNGQLTCARLNRRVYACRDQGLTLNLKYFNQGVGFATARQRETLPQNQADDRAFFCGTDAEAAGFVLELGLGGSCLCLSPSTAAMTAVGALLMEVPQFGVGEMLTSLTM